MCVLDVRLSICHLLTLAQWALHTSLALWWRRWWRCFPAPGSTLGTVDWGLEELEARNDGWDATGSREEGRGNEGKGGGWCWSNGALGRIRRRRKGKGQLSLSSTLSCFMGPSLVAPLVLHWKVTKTQRLVCLLTDSPGIRSFRYTLYYFHLRLRSKMTLKTLQSWASFHLHL